MLSKEQAEVRLKDKVHELQNQLIDIEDKHGRNSPAYKNANGLLELLEYYYYEEETHIEDLLEQRYQEGWDEGQSDGYDEGYDEGYNEGLYDGESM